jgi:2-hydroxy-3-keto-5-methylthiopentenyl-1-phosphate phosphatase
VCAECGNLCKRGSLPDDRPLAFVGDGYSDRCAALACDRVFARDSLAGYLDSQQVAYERFETFDDVADALDAE